MEEQSTVREQSIVRGNDFYLMVPLYQVVLASGEAGGDDAPTASSMPLDECSLLQVFLVSELGERKPLQFVLSEDNRSKLIVKVCGNSVICGWYGIEVLGILNGRQFRSFERRVFRIVENNGSSYVSASEYAGESSYQIDAMWVLYACPSYAHLFLNTNDMTLYQRGTVENGRMYLDSNGMLCLEESGSVAPTGILLGKVAFTPRGTYDDSATYDFYDMVFDGDCKTYISLRRDNTSPLSDVLSWAIHLDMLSFKQNLATEQGVLLQKMAAAVDGAVAAANTAASLARDRAAYASDMGRNAAESRMQAERAATAANNAATAANNAAEAAASRMNEQAQAFSDAQTSRQTAFNNSQTARQTSFEDAQSARQAAFNLSQAKRQEDYEETEGTQSGSVAGDGTRWGIFKASEAARSASFDDTQTGRATAFNNAQADRTTAFNNAQAERTTLFNGSQEQRQVAYETSEGTSSSTAGDGSRWGAYKQAETGRNITFTSSQAERQEDYEEAEGTKSGSVAGDDSRWGAYKANEAARYVAFANAQEERTTNFNNAQLARQAAFNDAQDLRQRAYETTEGTSSSAAGDGSRWGAYKTAEAARNTNANNVEGTSSSTAGDGSRWGAYKQAEALRDTNANNVEGTSASEAGDGTRWGAYKTAEAERQTAFENSQTSRQRAFSDAQDARTATFNSSQSAQQTAYEMAEGTESESEAGDGSRWGAFKTNEAARDAEVNSKVQSITTLQTDVAALQEDVTGATALLERNTYEIPCEADFDAMPLLGGQPAVLFCDGAPTAGNKPTNWIDFMDGGYEWTGLPNVIGQHVRDITNGADYYGWLNPNTMLLEWK